jgi:hypothetical protein
VAVCSACTSAPSPGGLAAADLDRGLAGSGRTWGWAVGHVAEHESYHLGKCMLLRNLLPARQAR